MKWPLDLKPERSVLDPRLDVELVEMPQPSQDVQLQRSPQVSPGRVPLELLGVHLVLLSRPLAVLHKLMIFA